MMEVLLSWTALPNLHPALIHFPIALAAVALLFDSLHFAAPTRVRFDRSATLLWALAAVGAGAAYWAGREAAEGLGVLPAGTEAALAAHADSAWTTLIAIGVLAAARLALWRRDQNAVTFGRDPARVVVMLAALALQGLLVRTADLGGALVFRHGVAVAAPAESDHEQPPAQSIATGETGVVIRVADRARLELAGAFRAARLEARLDTSEFSGSVTLGAVADAENADLLRADRDGKVALVALRDGVEQVLDEGSAQRLDAVWTILLTTSGSHWKGFVDGRNVVHGHTRSIEAMGAELVFEGNGTVRVVSFGTRAAAEETAESHHQEHQADGGHEHGEHAH